MSLKLVRKLGEEIRIGDDIKITIVSIHKNHVGLAFDAPKHIKIDRAEVYDKKHALNQFNMNHVFKKTSF